jgi:hypothetical protein
MASNTLVHASRVWPFCAVELTPQRQALRRGWGDPVLQRVYRELKLSGFVEDQGAQDGVAQEHPVVQDRRAWLTGWSATGARRCG